MSHLPPPPPPGTPPPPPPYGGGPTPPSYGGQPPYGAPPRWELGECLSWAWAKFQQNAGQMIAAAALVLVGIVVLEGLNLGLTIAHSTSVHTVCDAGGCRTSGGGSFIVTELSALAIALVLGFFVQVVSTGIFRGAMAVSDGRAFDLGEAFSTDKLGKVLLTALLVTLASAVGTVLCIVPGLVVAFVFSYATYFAVMTDLGPIDSMRASFDLVKGNLGTTLAWWLVGGLIAGLGVVVCCVGVLATFPIYVLGTAYTYRRLTGHPVAP